MNSLPWSCAFIALVGPLLGALWLTARGRPAQRLVGSQLLSSMVCVMLVAASFALDQASIITVALTLVLLSISAGFLFALFLERWL